ncbi:hypothetical protein BJ508DRAFT_324737 [Ascobolus immersus RN42]|uniref:Uncharacterized protein n=1 Tax=Ascobolus immersus RN42 TaxID=1160509 RepID=A0A3N4IAM6_ASCIM|nr:hypothetical protein BJ508DRAFT_324737 [Ascobolus immersus RN42]
MAAFMEQLRRQAAENKAHRQEIYGPDKITRTIQMLTLPDDNKASWYYYMSAESAKDHAPLQKSTVCRFERTVAAATPLEAQSYDAMFSELGKLGPDAARGLDSFVKVREKDSGTKLDIAYIKVIEAMDKVGKKLGFPRTILVELVETAGKGLLKQHTHYVVRSAHGWGLM